MTTDSELQIYWPTPGDWATITITPIYRDAEGYVRNNDTYTQADIPAALAPALAAAITQWTAMDAPWRARMVIATESRTGVITAPAGDGGQPAPVETIPCVMLTVHAEDGTGGRKVITASDDPACIITAPGAVDFYRYFTSGSINS